MKVIIKRKIGDGSFGEVYEVYNVDDESESYALKCVKRTFLI